MMKIAKWIKRKLKSYPELYSIPIALLAWVVSIEFLRALDETAGVFDAGVFQIPIFSIILLFVFLSVAWLAMGLLFGSLRRFLKDEFKQAFQEFTVWEKTLLSYLVFFSLVLSLVVLSFVLT
jgi:hypothetical protein